MKARRGVWVVFGAGAVAVGAAMAWITASLLHFEAAQQEAKSDAVHAETLRLALWRMDSWLGPEIAAETAPNTTHPRNVVRSVYQRFASGAPIALRGGDETGLRVVASIDLTSARKSVADAEEKLKSIVCEVTPAAVPAPLSNEYNSRAKANIAQQAANFGANGGGAPLAEYAGPLTPLWVPVSGADPALVFLQQGPRGPYGVPPRMAGWEVNGQGERSLTVHLADWAALRKGLLEQVADLVPAATLRPVLDAHADVERGFVLASAPIALDAPRPAAAELPLVTPTRTTLGVAWTALALAFVAIGTALRRTSDLSERRSRFASSVTHELRTPLTTFRLYSEMLADGMVTDPAQRQTYLDTLKSESSRLAHLVENVLAYSRVEEGRLPVRRERVALADLLLRVTPPLDRRAVEAGATLRVEAGAAASAVLDVDPDVVGQILFNLVDNAAKYAASADDRTIALAAAADGDRVRIVVRDHGPGIDAGRVRAAFTPFERAGRPAGDPVPGIGLGLALSRALARDLGGDLDYEPAAGGGAAFALTLPIAARA